MERGMNEREEGEAVIAAAAMDAGVWERSEVHAAAREADG